MGTVAGTVVENEAVAVSETGVLPVFYVVTKVVLGGAAEIIWVKIDVLISLYAVSSCALVNLKQDSRCIFSLY